MANIISPQIPAKFNVTLTWLYTVLVLILSVMYWWDYAKLSTLERFADPISVVSDSIGPELEYFDGLATLPDWQQRLVNFPGIDRKEFVEQAIKTWRQVIDILHTEEYLAEDQELHTAQIHLIVLIAEEQGWEAAEHQLQSWESYSHEAASYLRSLYKDNQFVSRPDYFPIDAYENSWTDLHIRQRAARLEGNVALVANLDAQLAKRASQQINRTIIYSLVWWLLMITGIVFLLLSYRRKLIPAAQYNVAWPGMDAIGVFIRAELLMIILLLLEGYLFVQLSNFDIGTGIFSLYYSWPSLWRGLIALLLIYLFLIQPRQVSMRDIFGLSLQRTHGVLPLLLWIIAIFSVDNLGTIFISYICDGLGCESPWAEGLSENILWGSTTDVVLEGIDTVIWAPIFEEIVFRGVLYLGLRQWCSPILAALISSLIFAFLHFYSLIGFIGVMWTGFVFALAFEYSRSLLPLIGAHMLTNLHWLLYSLLFYRY